MMESAGGAAFGGQVILSQDLGWYAPAEPGGGTPKPGTYLLEALYSVWGSGS